MDGQERRRGTRARLPGDHFVLVALPSGEERLEPILDLGPQGAAILLRAQRHELQVGSTIPRLRFFTRGTLSLDTAATVRDMSQVTLEGGGVGIKLGVQLALPGGSANPQDRLDGPDTLRDTVANLVGAKAEATLVPSSSDEQEASLPVAFARRHPSGEGIVLTWNDPVRPQVTEGERVDVVCELYGTRLALEVRLGAIDLDAQTMDATPLAVKIWRSRRLSRVHNLPSRLYVAFDSPFVRRRTSHEIMDVSQRGLCFVGDPNDGLMVGMRLDGLMVRLPAGTLSGCGIVRNIRYDDRDRLLVGLELADMSEQSQSILFAFVARTMHPKIRRAQLKDLRALWNIYENLDIFPRDRAATSPLAGRVETTRRVLLERGRKVFSQVVALHEDHLQGAAELLHTFSHTWTLQHAGTLPNSRMPVEQLVVPLIQDARTRSDFQRIHTILDPRGRPATIERLRSVPFDGSELAWREWLLFVASRTAITSTDPADVREGVAEDAPWIVARLQERFTQLEQAALDFSVKELALSTTGNLYRELGLERRRLVRMARGVSEPVGFSLIQQSSPGLSFSGTTDITRIVVTSRDPRTRKLTMARLVADLVDCQRDLGRRHSHIFVSIDDAPLATELGLEYVGSRFEVVASADRSPEMINFMSLLD